MSQQNYCIGGILHEILKIRTYKEFFGKGLIGISYTDFKPLGEKGNSSKVHEFIDKYSSSDTIVGPMHFIEYLLNHNSDNVLKLQINQKVNPGVSHSTGLELVKEAFSEFKLDFFNQTQIPFTNNLSEQVTCDNYGYNKVIGRERELKEIKVQLGKTMKNNIVLLGDGGVGKTAIVEEYAYREKDNVTIFELNVLGLISRGKEAPAVLENILETITNITGDKILFIDEFHVLIKEGLADAIKRLTSRNSDLKFIVATTTDEFKMFVEKDKALERRFYPIQVKELEGEELTIALEEWVNHLEERYKIQCDKEIIPFVIEKMKVERQKTSPDKEKDVIDATFSRCRIDKATIVDKEKVADVMSIRLSIPKEQLMSKRFDVILELEKNLKNDIKGQDNAIKNIVKVIESSQMRKSKNKPLAVMFFAGPTSVGKTEMAKRLAKYMFGSEKNLIQIDCTNYKEQHTASSLLGSPPGYVGYESGGQLINDVRKKPFSVILFDEFEKAHKDIHDILLPMFEEGIITDRAGRVADVTNTIIILTSNLGAKNDTTRSIGNNKSVLNIGFGAIDTEEEYEEKQNDLTERYKSYLGTLKNKLRPELIARINEIIVFSKLSEDVIREIIDKKLTEMCNFYKSEYSMTVTYTENIIKLIEKKASKNPRKIGHAIEKYIQSQITRAYINQKIYDKDTFDIDILENKVALILKN